NRGLARTEGALMKDAIRARLEALRASMRGAIAERDSHYQNSCQTPSEFWRKASSHLNYIFDLTPENLQNIRLHIGMGHYLGPWWAEVMYDKHKYEGNSEATQKLSYIKEYDKHTRGLPANACASEPIEVDSSRDISFYYQGKYVNWDVVKRQITIYQLQDV